MRRSSTRSPARWRTPTPISVSAPRPRSDEHGASEAWSPCAPRARRDAWVREAAARALGQISIDQALDILADVVMNDPARAVREAAARPSARRRMRARSLP